MKNYFYSKKTQHLYVNENFTKPFLCPAEAEPLKFRDTAECLEFLARNNFEGSVMYKLYEDQY